MLHGVYLFSLIGESKFIVRYFCGNVNAEAEWQIAECDMIRDE